MLASVVWAFAFAALAPLAALASIHCCNCNVDIAAFASSPSLLSTSRVCSSFTKSRISDPLKVSIWPCTFISSCAKVINAHSNPFIFLSRILLLIRVFGASSLPRFVPMFFTPRLCVFRWFGVLHKQQFCMLYVSVTYKTSIVLLLYQMILIYIQLHCAMFNKINSIIYIFNLYIWPPIQENGRT